MASSFRHGEYPPCAPEHRDSESCLPAFKRGRQAVDTECSPSVGIGWRSRLWIVGEIA
ncbi:hypothetical protein P170DRAFT_438514 [Aspergillus steynii IBT 23096]|uniref:Uncharacterized protein n=1 Tax=Aspergillus steynii IBT 23096 TaxID=1392250 RepID=A0A2I2G1R1_9EURO|nr:uncharacterized protein P170DRAFT_438514 [Aspergillus steynii IBT 23096]PLB46810.1 hypothetical protein P170DRAFT_438514 [Aspergillus steynii IBT 23096]